MKKDNKENGVRQMRSATIHVGVNITNTPPLQMVMPVFDDGSFIFIPFPSDGEGQGYQGIRSTVQGACEIVESMGFMAGLEVHNDPEFIGCTFGEGPLPPERGRGHHHRDHHVPCRRTWDRLQGAPEARGTGPA